MLNILHSWHLVQTNATKFRRKLTLCRVVSSITVSNNTSPKKHPVGSLSNGVEGKQGERKLQTYTLPNSLNILLRHSNPPQSPHMPRRFAGEILHDNSRYNRHLRLNIVQDIAIRQKEAVGDVFRKPILVPLYQHFSILLLFLLEQMGGGDILPKSLLPSNVLLITPWRLCLYSRLNHASPRCKFASSHCQSCLCSSIIH